QYTTTGTAPNRVLVMEFFNVDHFPSGNNVTTQVHLYETSNLIEIHTVNMPTNGDVHTMGIENIDGTDALAVPGRNASTTWSASNDYVAFIPLVSANTDNCSVASETIDISSFDCSNVGANTVTMTVTDDAGNTSTCTSTVTVMDTISPTITCPVDIVQDQDAGVCSADVTVPNITTADNCSGETIAWTVTGATTAAGTGQPGLQTFAVGLSTVDVTATDASGNTANCMFTVTVNDTVAPTLPVLADSIGECSVTVAAPTTTDNCNGTITGTTTDPTTVSAQGTTVITWTFDDGSGNITTATQNVIINDAIAPTATNIDTAFAECIGDVAIDITLVDDEADNCTAAPVVAYVGDVASNGTGCNDTITRTYSVTDDGGNSTNVEQIIILNDVTAPTASNPVTLNVVCLGDVPSTAGAASWVTDEADNCGNPIVTWLNDVSSNGTGCNDTITRTFEVADACGNSIQVQQMIIVNDDDVPVADVATLADVTATCDASPTAPTATDNCAGTLNGVPDVTFPISTVGTTVVTWTYTDNCGNTATQTQNVTVTGVDVGTTMASDNITMIATNINAGVTYQWYDCVAGTIVAGETNVNFTPSYGSDFAVIVTENGCVDTSACVNSTVGLDQLQLEQFVMYPNPTETGSFSIQLDVELKEVSVLDMTGRLVEVDVNLTEKTVNVSNLVNGAYIVRVVTETEQELVGTVRVQ
ncbi:HYR domain-containing protein, partial [Crocinitomicaceae bacterium]|nr:HYR domain-containing protein [Crocinitomicaceae bacterium]